MALRPFEQLPFEEVPDRPRIAHDFARTREERVALSTKGFGRAEVAVRRIGAGPPLLLIHGFMTSSYSFRYLIEPLQKSFELVIPDLIGAGRSDKPNASYRPEALVESLQVLIDTLDMRGATVIGNSLGGYLTMRLAMSSPASVGRLVCIHAPGLPTPRMHALRLALAALPFAETLLDALVSRDPERWVHKNVHYYDESLKSREEHREYAAPLRTVEGRRAFFRMLSETLDVREMSRFERELRALDGRFPVPLQLVYARRDPMVPPAVGERLAALLPHAEFAWIEGGSHFCHVDAVSELLAATRGFIMPS